ncbi:Bifunctional dihydroflavonol 4-reductase/flavanone 4-reductase [Sesbania bispinosa]|nr:Bifunctional dihydroflavonol 4-reductase/flavanone 4-reductase [Sesbania bispinosa]
MVAKGVLTEALIAVAALDFTEPSNCDEAIKEGALLAMTDRVSICFLIVFLFSLLVSFPTHVSANESEANESCSPWITPISLKSLASTISLSSSHTCLVKRVVYTLSAFAVHWQGKEEEMMDEIIGVMQIFLKLLSHMLGHIQFLRHWQ